MVGVLEERRREEEEEGHADVDVVNAVVVVVGQSHGFSSMMETNRVSARGRRAGVGRTIWVVSVQRTDRRTSGLSNTNFTEYSQTNTVGQNV